MSAPVSAAHPVRERPPATALRWLYEELPGLVGAGVLRPETAERLRAHYGPVEPARTGRDRVLLIFGVLGALLVGLGIILIFAFNWNTLSRGAKTVVSFLPLLLGQLLLGFALARRRDSAAWRESSATFLFLGLGASLGLIHQVYQIGGDLGPFLLTWLLLAAPLVYLAEASLPALLFLGGVALWSSTLWGRPLAGRLVFWPMVAIPLPYLWWRMRQHGDGGHAVLLRWAYVLLLLPGFALTYGELLLDHWPLVLGAFLGLVYLLEALWRGGGTRAMAAGAWQRPFHVAGAIGLAAFGLACTFAYPWHRGLDPTSYRGWRAGAALDLEGRTLLVLVFLGYFLVLAIGARRGRLEMLGLGSLPISAILGYGLVMGDHRASLVAWLFSAHVLVASVWGIVQGMRQERLATVTGSLGMLSLLVLLRFFDSDMGLMARGLVFIAVGLGFLLSNAVLARRMRS